jgi:hypothetical protein
MSHDKGTHDMISSSVEGRTLGAYTFYWLFHFLEWKKLASNARAQLGLG